MADPFGAERIPLLRFQPGGGCSWAHPPMSKINLRRRSPPRAMTGRENNVRGNYPSNAWNDSKTAVLRQLPAPAKTGAGGVGHSAPKRKFRTAFANTVRNLYTVCICAVQTDVMLLPNRRRLPVRREAQLLDRNRRTAVEQVFQSRLPLTLRCNAPQAVATDRKHSEHSVIADFHRRMPRQILCQYPERR